MKPEEVHNPIRHSVLGQVLRDNVDSLRERIYGSVERIEKEKHGRRKHRRGKEKGAKKSRKRSVK